MIDHSRMRILIFYTMVIVLCWNVGTTTSAQVLKFKPAPSTPLTSPATVTATVNTTVIVLCNEPGGTVQWYGPDGGVVPSSGDVRQAGTSSSRQNLPRREEEDNSYRRLAFTSYQSSQGGQYQCRTSKKDGTNSTLYVTFETNNTSPTREATQSTSATQATPSTPQPPTKVKGVMATRTVQGSSPALRVSWSAVSGSGITYTVCYSTTSDTQSDQPPGDKCGASGITGTSTTLGPLSIGTTYYIWVAAVSSGGQGAYSDRQQARTHNAPPAPSHVKVTPLLQRGLLGVSWRAPPVDTGLTISGYSVQYRTSSTGPYSNARTVSGSSTSTTISGLQLGTTYRIRVAAVTQLGTGVNSSDAVGATYNHPPAPSGVRVNPLPQRGVLKVAWTAPTVDTELTITGYSVQYRTSSTEPYSNAHTVSGSSTSTTISGLRLGTTYRVRVAAVTQLGTGVNSSDVFGTTYDVPSKVSGVTVTKAVRSSRPALMVRWTRRNANERVTGYQVQYRRGTSGEWKGKRVSSMSTSTDLKMLDSSSSYQVRVNALSDIGDGPVGNIRVQTTYSDPPAPISVIVTPLPQHGVLRVTWRAPTVDTGLTISGYSMQYRTSDTGSYSRARTVSGRSTSTTISSLQLGTRYRVRVAAVTQLGTGVYSSDVSGTTYKHPPAPSNVTARPISQHGVLRVSWRAPTVDIGLTITGYSIQYRTSSTGPYSRARTVSGSSTSTTISGLQLGTRYRVRVAAVTQLGAGVNSSDVVCTTYDVPKQITGVQYTLSSNNNVLSMTVTWNRPSTDVVLTRYEVLYSEDGTSQSTLTASTEQIMITGTVGRSYRVRVRAVSAVGTGKQSESITIGPPSPPSNISISSSTTTLTARWDNGGYNYRLHVQKKGSTEIRLFGPVTPPYNITGLESNTEYTVIVEAYTLAGNANRSKVAYALPKAPGDLLLDNLSSTSMRVTWTPPPNAERLHLTYHVGYFSEFTVRMSATTTELSLIFTGLHPFDEYTITVEAENNGGSGRPVVMKATTLSAVPVLAPVVTSPVEPRSRSAPLQWSLPPKKGRNGIITRYIVELWVYVTEVGEFKSIRNITVPNDRPPDITHLVTDLTPFTRYAWKVAAVNDAGVGVLTSSIDFKTLEDVPGPVSNLSYNITSNTSAVIMWSEPEEPNGVITGYDVVYGVYEEDNSTTVNVTDFTLAIRNLIPERPIEASVSARTNIGEGENVSKIFFTSEGVPSVKVQNVVTEWINDNSAVHVSWTPLTLHEARGFPLYVVTYWPSSLNGVSGNINSVTTTNSSVVIGGLDPTTSYSITVDVYTGNGTIKGSVTADIHNVDSPVVLSNYGVIAGALVAVLATAVIIIIIALVIILCRRKNKYSESFKPSKAENNKDGNLARVDMEMFPVEVEENIRDFSTPISKVNFAQHATALHARSDEGFEVEYQTIVNDPNGMDDIAKDHRHKNRYLNIYTYNHSRVTLSVTDENGSDYINASYIDGYKVNKQYIAAQGPTRTTKADFIQMIWDHKSPVIVMLTRLTENGKPKCERYWNDELNTPLELSERFTVTTTDLKSYNGYEMRTLSIKNVVDDSGKPHYVKHFYYTAWPDHGVPECPSSIVRFVQHVRRQFQGGQSPLVVHCSAGVGRTGTFLAIDTMMLRLEEKDDLNIYEFVTYMRTRRTFMVQNQDQYSFIHDAIADYITCGHTTLSAHELRRAIAELDVEDPHIRETGFQKQYNVLEQTSKSPREADATIFMKPAIVKKNRFKNKYPYSSGYLHLPGKTGGVGADYYNASFVDSFYSQKAFIAAQSPLTNTRGDLWELVWSFKTPTIVLLCDFKEGEEDSCCKFWPDEQLRSIEYGNLSITFNGCTQFDGYQMLTFNVKDIKQKNRPPHPVTLFHFKEWPIDGGPPVDALLAMMGEIQKCQAGKEKPPIVMCNDGMGRTGVFTTILSEIERVKLEGEVDIFNAVKSSRNKRPHMVCTVDQYRLCFELLQAYLDSFDTYANFKAV